MRRRYPTGSRVLPAGAGGPGLPALPGVAGQGAARAAEDRQAGLRLAGQDHRAGIPGGQLRAAGGHPPAAHAHPLPQAADPGPHCGEGALREAAGGRAPEAVVRDQRHPRRCPADDMLRAVIAGERDPEALAQKARDRMRRKIAQLRRDLDYSFFTPDHAFGLPKILRAEAWKRTAPRPDPRWWTSGSPTPTTRFCCEVAQLDDIPTFVVRDGPVDAEIGVGHGPASRPPGTWAPRPGSAPGVRENRPQAEGKDSDRSRLPFIGGALGEAAAGAGAHPDLPGRRAPAPVHGICRRRKPRAPS